MFFLFNGVHVWIHILVVEEKMWRAEWRIGRSNMILFKTKGRRDADWVYPPCRIRLDWLDGDWLYSPYRMRLDWRMLIGCSALIRFNWRGGCWLAVCGWIGGCWLAVYYSLLYAIGLIAGADWLVVPSNAKGVCDLTLLPRSVLTPPSPPPSTVSRVFFPFKPLPHKNCFCVPECLREKYVQYHGNQALKV